MTRNFSVTTSLSLKCVDSDSSDGRCAGVTASAGAVSLAGAGVGSSGGGGAGVNTSAGAGPPLPLREATIAIPMMATRPTAPSIMVVVFMG